MADYMIEFDPCTMFFVFLMLWAATVTVGAAVDGAARTIAAALDRAARTIAQAVKDQNKADK